MVAQSGGQGSLIGATIGGYKVEALIGRGAMGAVYLGRDVKLNRLVALKVLLGSLAKTQSQVKEFLQEAQTAAPLHHPGIVRIYSAGVEDGTPYIAMEFVNGEPLDRFLKRKGALKWDVALQIARKLAAALHAAHKAGIVHRDVKPSNIMLDQKGGVRLTDFGIAQMQTEGRANTGQGFLGTPQYMSPEQATGGEITTSSDLYSLGVTLYEMISGELPFTGESPMALINSICNDDATRLNVKKPDVPDDVARFVAYLMGKTPKDRPANAKVAYAMAERLQKQKGELSSVSDSLTGFIQEAMEVRPFQSALEASANAGKKPNPVDAKKRRERNRVYLHTVARISIVLVAGIAAFGLGTQIKRTDAIDLESSVPPITELIMGGNRSGGSVIQLPDAAHAFQDLHWIGDSSILWITTRGKSGLLAEDAVGALGFDVESRTSYTLATPEGPSLTIDSDPIHIQGLRAAQVVSTLDEHPMGNHFLTTGTDSRSGEVIIVARQWDRATPDPTVIQRFPAHQWTWYDDGDALHPHRGQAVLHPDGETIAYLLHNTNQNYTYVIEQTRDELNQWVMGEERTTVGVDIHPGSLHYSPDGSQLMYLRGDPATGAELWSLEARGSEVNGKRIKGRIMSDVYAISPDGNLVALALQSGLREQKAPEIALVQTRTGVEVDRFGPGSISTFAFHPSGNYLVLHQNSPSNTSSEQEKLVAIDLRDTQRVVDIPSMSGGMSRAYAFSRDGRFLAAIPNNQSTPSLNVFEWKTLVASN